MTLEVHRVPARATLFLGEPGSPPERCRIRIELGSYPSTTEMFFDGERLRGCFFFTAGATTKPLQATTLAVGFVRMNRRDVNGDALAYLERAGVKVHVIDLTSDGLRRGPAPSPWRADDELDDPPPQPLHALRRALEMNASANPLSHFYLLLLEGYSEAEAQAVVWPSTEEKTSPGFLAPDLGRLGFTTAGKAP
jgi:hypothetical protein